jgi:hypothetical protein
MQHPINLKAGIRTTVGFQGVYFALLDVGASIALEVAVFAGSVELERIKTAPRGMTFDAQTRFDKIELIAQADCVVQVVVSEGRVRLGAMDGTNVNATILNSPLPVVPDRGAPANPVYVSGLTYSDAPAASAVDAAPVVVTSAGAVVCAANAAGKSLRFHNQGPDAVAIVPPAGTWARRVQVLEVGDVWVEDRGANLAWSAITDATKTATVTVLRVLS